MGTTRTTRTISWQATFAVLAAFLGLVLVAGFLPAGEAQAATIDVDQVEDAYDDGSKTCSLREAIVSANRNISIDSCDAGSPSETDVINVPHQVDGYDLTIVGAGEDSGEMGDLDITEDVTIQGAGPITEPAEIDAGGEVDTGPDCDNKRVLMAGFDRVLHIHEPPVPPTEDAPEAFGTPPAINVQLYNLTITGGSVVGPNESDPGGGGILAETANLSLDTVSVIGNTVTNFEEEGDAYGGGISLDSDSRLFVSGGRIANNYAEAEVAAGAGIYQDQENQQPDSPEAASLGDPVFGVDISGNKNGDALLQGNRLCASFMASGGAVSVGDSLAVDEAYFDDNAVTGDALGFGGAVASPIFGQSTLIEVEDSTFQSNVVGGLGDEFFISGAFGGAVATFGDTFIDRTTFEENEAIALGEGGSVGAGGGAVAASGFFEMEDSTLNDNTAFTGDLTPDVENAARLGGQEPEETPDSFGGGLLLQSAEAELLNSTFSGNTAYNGGAIAHGEPPKGPPPKFGPQGPGPQGLGNSGFDFITVTNNSATEGAGIWTGDGPNEVHLFASIVGDQESGDDCLQLTKGGLLDEGDNLDSDSTCVTEPSSDTDDPELDELDDNGGRTETHALLEGSPAIDMVNGDCPPEDQRGRNRPEDGDGTGPNRCDAGAFELRAPEPPDPLFCPGFKNDPRPQIIGTPANNVLNGTNADEVICGKAGTDTINGGGGDDLILGGPDNDKIKGQGGNDRVVGGGGADEVNGNGGNDRLRGYPGNDTLNGDDGEDRITGGIDNDTVNGDAGDDKVFGWDGNDEVNGNGGSDHTFGSLGDDNVDGGPGNDRVRGYKGDDKLFGRDGEDKLVGNLGDDNLNGGPDTDTCFGGPGTNTLVNCP